MISILLAPEHTCAGAGGEWTMVAQNEALIVLMIAGQSSPGLMHGPRENVGMEMAGYHN